MYFLYTTQSLHCLLRVSPPSEPLQSFSLLQCVFSLLLISRCFTRVLLLNPPCKRIKWQICKYEKIQLKKLQKYICSSPLEMVSLDISGFASQLSNGGENVFLWHLMAVLPHCSIIKGLLYAISILNGSTGPLFVCGKKTSGEL